MIPEPMLHPARGLLRWSVATMLALFLTAGLLPSQERAVGRHFMPRGHVLGDVHPCFHEGGCYLYSLKPKTYESVLAMSRDMVRWREVPISHAAVAEGDWFSPYFVLGVFFDPATGLHRSFFGHAQGRMASSQSADLLHWECAPKEYHVPPADYYERRRDPFVFWIPESKEYGCVMTTWMKGRPKPAGGAVSLATSPDLKQWTDHGPLIDPGNIGEPECPQMFRLGGRWYLLASIYDRAVGRPVYWQSGTPRGPWRSTPDGQLDGKDLCAAQIAFDGDTPVLFGWIPLEPSRPGEQHWGGHLALPRDVYQREDGRLATRLSSRINDALKAPRWKSFGDAGLSADAWKVEGEWDNPVLECELSLSAEAQEAKVRITPLGEVVFSRDGIRLVDAKGEIWSELPASLPQGRPMRVQVFTDGDIVEVFADNRCSLAARLPKAAGPVRLSFVANGRGAMVKDLRVAEWLSP